MKKPPARPKRDPLWRGVRRRSAECALIEVWATKHTWRSTDPEMDGLTYYRPLVFIGGEPFDHMPRRCATAQAAVDYVLGQLAGAAA